MSRSVFPPAASLLSRAWWRLADHPAPLLLLGLGGSAPFAALLLLFLKESEAGSAAPMGLAFAAAGAYLLRWPARLALARWTALEARGMASVPAALGFAAVQLPSACLYGALATLGCLGGLAVVVPFQLSFLAGFAANRFAASGEESAWASLKACGRAPLWGTGMRLICTAFTLWTCLFLLLWQGPGLMLTLASWFLKMDTVAASTLFDSFSWTAAAAVLAWTAADLLWALAWGILAEEWRNLSEGDDLAATLRALETAEAA